MKSFTTVTTDTQEVMVELVGHLSMLQGTNLLNKEPKELAALEEFFAAANKVAKLFPSETEVMASAINYSKQLTNNVVKAIREDAKEWGFEKAVKVRSDIEVEEHFHIVVSCGKASLTIGVNLPNDSDETLANLEEGDWYISGTDTTIGHKCKLSMRQLKKQMKLAIKEAYAADTVEEKLAPAKPASKKPAAKKPAAKKTADIILFKAVHSDIEMKAKDEKFLIKVAHVDDLEDLDGMPVKRIIGQLKRLALATDKAGVEDRAVRLRKALRAALRAA